MYDLTRLSLDAVNAELNYRHTVDISPSAAPRARRHVLRRRLVRHGRIRHGEIR